MLPNSTPKPCYPTSSSTDNPEEKYFVGSNFYFGSTLIFSCPSHRQQDPNADTSGHILCVIGHIAKHLPQSTRNKVTGACLLENHEKALPLTLYIFLRVKLQGNWLSFLDVIKSKLNGFCWSPKLISPAVDTLQRLCRASAETPAEEQVRYRLSWVCLSFVCT